MSKLTRVGKKIICKEMGNYIEYINWSSPHKCSDSCVNVGVGL